MYVTHTFFDAYWLVNHEKLGNSQEDLSFLEVFLASIELYFDDLSLILSCHFFFCSTITLGSLYVFFFILSSRCQNQGLDHVQVFWKDK